MNYLAVVGEAVATAAESTGAAHAARRGQRGDGGGRARPYRLIAPARLGEGQQRVVDLGHGLLVVARGAGAGLGCAGWVHDVGAGLLAHARGPSRARRPHATAATQQH